MTDQPTLVHTVQRQESCAASGRNRHTDWMRAPFWPFPEPAVVSAEPFLRFSEDFCLFTTSWLDELKLSEAWRFMAGMFIFGACTLDRDMSETESASPNHSRVSECSCCSRRRLDNFRSRPKYQGSFQFSNQGESESRFKGLLSSIHLNDQNNHSRQSDADLYDLSLHVCPGPTTGIIITCACRH